MKRIIAILLAMTCLCAAASAEVSADGAVSCGASVAQLAAMGGLVSDVSVMAGDYVRPGDALVTLTTTRVYAPCSGTVETLFAGIGQNADAAVEQYGGVISIAPESLFTIYATTDDAYDSVRTSHISSGQTVYMKCTKDGTHRGVGRVTRIEGNIFLVEATGGAFYNGETVYVYMESDYDSADRLGKGTAVATPAVNVEAAGDIVRVYVSAGDFVEKGQLLMETLAALPLDGFLSNDFTLRAQSEGYVTAVHAQLGQTIERGGLLIEFCPADGLEFIAKVAEEDLPYVRVGDDATVLFELAEEDLSLAGRVQAISFLPETNDGATTYDVRISIPANISVHPGMHATAVIG